MGNSRKASYRLLKPFLRLIECPEDSDSHPTPPPTYQVKGEIVDLVEGLSADVALEGLLIVVRQFVVLVVALLVEALAAELALIRFVACMNAHVRVEGAAAVEGLAAVGALVRLLRRVDDLVAAEGGRLPKALSADLAHEGTCSSVHGHVPRQVVVGVEDLAALAAAEALAPAATAHNRGAGECGTVVAVAAAAVDCCCC